MCEGHKIPPWMIPSVKPQNDVVEDFAKGMLAPMQAISINGKPQ